MEVVTNEDAKTGARKSFDELQAHLNDSAPIADGLARMKGILVKGFMARINPPLKTDQDYQNVFGVSESVFQSTLAQASPSN